jgi:transposase
MEKKKADGHKLCRSCRSPSSPSSLLNSSTSDQSPLQPLFDRDNTTVASLLSEQRWAIINLHKDGQKRATIASKITCNIKTVNHWISHYKQNGSVEDKRRSGRKRKTDENTDVNIIASAVEKKFTTPKMIKREQQLAVCTRTIRRRLNEAGLYGHVARKEYPFTDDHIRKRLSFANGYKGWTMDQWDTVLFSDETHIELGPHGQVWVQRPLGAAFEPQYMTTKDAHPARISIWGCFSGHGLGEIEIFTDILDARKMKAILDAHLLPSANCFFCAGAWWFLQDNDPKHRSRLVQRWLFTHGVQCIDFPPYSPDLNPIENLWNDLKRRIEKLNARDIAELRAHVNEEWAATDTNLLSCLSHSMPGRCKAVIANRGHKTTY